MVRPTAESITYDVTLGPNVAGVRLVANTVEFLDAIGAPRLRMAPPFIADIAATDCPPGNLLEHASLAGWLDTAHASALLTDGAVVPEGKAFLSQAVLFESNAASLTYDLGSATPIRAAFLQADAEGAYSLQGSMDGRSWRAYSMAPVPEGTGMRSRFVRIESFAARFIRIGEPVGGGLHAATELQVFCQPPADLTGAIRVIDRDPAPDAPSVTLTASERAWLDVTGVPWLTEPQANVAKLLLSLAATALLVFGAFADRRPLGARRSKRARDAVLVALALTSSLGYFNWGSYRFPDYIHDHEFFHYFVGSKYFRELGYDRLYECASLADAEQGFERRVELGAIRDLKTRQVVDGRSALRKAQECRDVFSPARWADFRLDVAYFRDHADVTHWRQTLLDHGYNPSPLWTMTGASLANLHRASGKFIGRGDSMWHGALGLIDPALLFAMMGAVLWAFGWRTACVAAIFLGCSPLSGYLWTGGSFMRQDWLFATMLGLCLLKKGSPALAGVSLAYATLVRLFPGAFFLPVLIHAGATIWRARRVDPTAARVLVGAAIAAAVLIPGSGWATGRGLRAWRDFGENTAKHWVTPTANLVGLPAVLSYRPSTRAELLADPTREDPFAPVREARTATLSRMRPLYAILVVVFLALFSRASVRTAPVWKAVALGAMTIPFLSQLSSYYASYLTPGALLWDERRASTPIALLSAAAALCIVHVATDQEDVRAVWGSLILLIFSIGTTWLWSRPARSSEVT